MKEIQSYIMISPQLIGLVVFSIYPILWVFRYSFYDYDGITATFTGLDNFVRAFTRDPQYWKSVLNTMIIAYGKLIIELPLALLAAVLLSHKLVKIKKPFNLIYYLPKVTGTASNAMIFTFLFASFNGVVNNMLMKIGIINAPISWFSNTWSSFAVIMIMAIWSGFATNTLYFMAGVQSISDDVIEASEIDGANKIQQFFYVTLPMLAPTVRVILMLAMVNGMKIMNEVLLLTNGGPAGTTDVVMLRIYKMYYQTDGMPELGYASALGVITTVIIGIVTAIYLKISKKADEVY